MNSRTTTQIDRLFQRYIAQGEIAGGAVAVIQGGKIVLEQYAGQAAPGLASGPQVLWPLASISKVYSVAAVMKFVEQGDLTLNTLVSQLIPSFTGGGREEVRLRHLLTHTAGMIYESPDMEELLKAHTPLAAMVTDAVAAELLFAPGSAVSYADYHTLLAGHMAEVVAGRPFAELVQELVLKPAELTNTFFPPPVSEHQRIAKVRGPLAEGTDGAMYNSAYALGLAHPAFGVVASVTDLARFATHFLPGGPRIHCEATVQAMTIDQTGGAPGAHPAMRGYLPGAPIPWGLGWYLQTASTPAVLTDLASFRSFGHGGASGCLLFGDPERDLAVGIVSNTHVRLDAERWRMRLQTIANCAVGGV